MVPLNFKMCKYCGTRIEKPFDRWGKVSKLGDYCSMDCSDACHGFDRRLESERRHKLVTFNPAKHDIACTQTLPPDKAMMLAEEGNGGPNRRIKVPSEEEIMYAAEEIDPRLPGILAGIKRGRTQDEMAKRLGIDQAIVSKLIKSIRVKFCM